MYVANLLRKRVSTRNGTITSLLHFCKEMRVAVVGAGIIGVTSAYAVKCAFPEYEVCIFAEEFSPNTTGDGSAGLWSPYLLSDTPADSVLRWAGITYRWLERFWKSDLAPEVGVSLLPIYRLSSTPGEHSTAVWTRLVHGARKLNDNELEKLNAEHKANYKEGWHFLTFTAEPVHLLQWLTARFVKDGGNIERRKVRSLHELFEEGYDLIINCSGLGARELVGDTTVIPFRGQVFRVKSSWLMQSYVIDDDDGNYIIPNIDSTVLGGTHQENDFDCTPREEDSRFIYEGCCRLSPSLRGAKIINSWVGLRPGRPRVRLEPETLRSSGGQEFTVIHNYGHGGSGVTLCWGCALDVVDIVRNIKIRRDPTSKL